MDTDADDGSGGGHGKVCWYVRLRRGGGEVDFFSKDGLVWETMNTKRK